MKELTASMKNLDENGVISTVQQLNMEGADPMEILVTLQEGMRQVGEEYEKGNYFLSELIMSATIFKSAMTEIKERLSAESEGEAEFGAYVIGTVEGDIHDIGKDIVANLLDCQGFKVVDIGVDQPPQAFVDAVKQYKPTVVGLSCLLTTAFVNLKATVETLRKEIARPDLKIIIGGATVTDETRQYAGADAFCTDANQGVVLAQKLAGGVR